MGKLFDSNGLTTPGSALLDPSGRAIAIGSPNQTLADSKRILQQRAGQVNIANPLDTSGQGPLPTIGRPSFAEAATAGATPGGVNAMSPGLSKLGKLGVLLRSGVEGALAGQAASENAVVQSGGRRSGGAGMGFEAGLAFPWQRAQQQQQVQRGAIENQMAQANLQPVQTPYGTMPWFRATQVAGLNKDIAETRAKGFVTPRGGGVYDVNAQQYAPGAGPTPQKESTPEQQALDYLTTATDPKLGRPLNEAEAYQRIEQIKAGTKPDTGSDFERYYSGLVKQGTADTPQNRMAAYRQWVKNEPQYQAAQAARTQAENARQQSEQDRQEKEGITPVIGQDADGRDVLVSMADAKKLGLSGVMKAGEQEVGKAQSARHWKRLAETTVPIQLSDPKNPNSAAANADQMGILQLIDHLDKRGMLGPIASRWNDFLAGKVGAGDPEVEALRTKMGLSTTLLMNAHVGSRGGSYMMEHFEDLANAGKMDADTLRAGVKSELNYINTRAMLPNRGGQKSAPASGTPLPSFKQWKQSQAQANL